MQTCKTCNKTKPYTDFHTNKTYTSGYVKVCKSCKAAWHLDNKAANNTASLARYKLNRDRQMGHF